MITCKLNLSRSWGTRLGSSPPPEAKNLLELRVNSCKTAQTRTEAAHLTQSNRGSKATPLPVRTLADSELQEQLDLSKPWAALRHASAPGVPRDARRTPSSCSGRAPARCTRIRPARIDKYEENCSQRLDLRLSCEFRFSYSWVSAKRSPWVPPDVCALVALCGPAPARIRCCSGQGSMSNFIANSAFALLASPAPSGSWARSPSARCTTIRGSRTPAGIPSSSSEATPRGLPEQRDPAHADGDPGADGTASGCVSAPGLLKTEAVPEAGRTGQAGTEPWCWSQDRRRGGRPTERAAA